jgi:hypothetical protein
MGPRLRDSLGGAREALKTTKRSFPRMARTSSRNAEGHAASTRDGSVADRRTSIPAVDRACIDAMILGDDHPPRQRRNVG